MKKVEIKLKPNSGVTLVALVVTIIILLLLSGVTIYYATSGGLIDKTQQAVIQQEKSTIIEAIALAVGEASLEEYQFGTNIKQYLLTNGYIDEEGIVNVKKLVGNELKTGNGSNNKDIYKIEGNDLVYYDKSGTKEVLQNLGQIEEPEVQEPLVQIEYEFDASTGTITGIKNKASYYTGGWGGYGTTGIGDCILPGGTVLKIPSQINGVQVKAIVSQYGGASGVFNNCKNITKVVIPSTVTQIGGQSTNEFFNCSSLQEVVIESETIQMGNYQFNGCSNLQKITFTNLAWAQGAPWGASSTCQIIYLKKSAIEYEFDSSTGTITGIKNKASYYEGGWSGPGTGGIGKCILPETEVVIPSHINGVEVKQIISGDQGGSGVFHSTNITKIVIPSTVTKISGPYTSEFLACESLKEVIIESNTLTIENTNQFYRCNNLQKITFTNIRSANAPSGSPWGAPSTCQIVYK